MSIVINNPNTIVDSSITTSKIADGAVTIAKLSTSLGNKNYFKNPAFSIVQGSASGTINASTNVPTASLGYPGETEWSISNNNDFINYSFSGQTLTFTSISSKNAFILQRIESVDAARLAGKTVTVSVEVAPSVAEGNIRIQLYRPTTTADTHGTLVNPTQTLISDSGQISLTSITSTRYSHTVTLPTTVNLGLEVRFLLNPGGSTANITFARPKLEEGLTATAFTCDDVAVELTKCQRYFFYLPPTAKGFPCPSTGGFAATYSYPFKQTMFRVPAISPTYTGVSNIAAYGTPVATVNGFSVQITGQNFTNTNWTISANCSAHIP